MAVGETHLHWADYVVTVVCLVAALGIGVFFALFRGGQNTKEKYLLGDRQLRLGPVCLSLFVSFQSAITLIGSPADVYNTGTMFFFIYLGFCLSVTVGYFTMAPLFYPLRLTSIYHYLQLRFRSCFVHTLIAIIGMLQTITYMGVALFSPALVMEAVIGIPLWTSVLLVGVIGTIYTAIGGIKSVVWTDVFQTLIVFIGIAAVLIKGIMRVGGLTKVVDIAADGGRLIFDEVDPRARHSYWSTILGGCVFWTINVFSQSSLQRISSLPSLSQAKRCFLLNVPLLLVTGLTLCVLGVLLYAYFVTTGCDPYAAGYVSNKNQVSSYFVLHVLRDLPGMSGLYMSVLFSGTLSTLSSGLNALAANTVEDVLARPLKGVKDTTVTVIAKVTVVICGCISVGLAYLMRNLSGPVTQMSSSVIGAFGAPVQGVFFLAAGFPRCNIYGATGGVVVGTALSVTVTVGATLYGAPTPSLPSGPVDRCDVTNITWTPDAMWNVTSVALGEGDYTSTTAVPVHSDRDFTLWDLSYWWFSVIGFSTTVISGIIISLLTGCKKEAEHVDPRLIFPFCRKIYGLTDPKDISKEENAFPMEIVCDGLQADPEATRQKDEHKETSAFIPHGGESTSPVVTFPSF